MKPLLYLLSINFAMIKLLLLLDNADFLLSIDIIININCFIDIINLRIATEVGPFLK